MAPGERADRCAFGAELPCVSALTQESQFPANAIHHFRNLSKFLNLLGR
jgi:hypothetical protein